MTFKTKTPKHIDTNTSAFAAAIGLLRTLAEQLDGIRTQQHLGNDDACGVELAIGKDKIKSDRGINFLELEVKIKVGEQNLSLTARRPVQDVTGPWSFTAPPENAGTITLNQIFQKILDANCVIA